MALVCTTDKSLKKKYIHKDFLRVLALLLYFLTLEKGGGEGVGGRSFSILYNIIQLNVFNFEESVFGGFGQF